MTSAAGASGTKARTAELVEDVLSAMRDSAMEGDPSAVSRLRPTEEKAAATPRIAHSVDEKIIFRPNGESYHVRKLGRHDDVAVLRKAREERIFALMYGPPGTGKTALIEAAFAPVEKKGAKLTSEGVYTVQGSGDTTVDDFIGGYVQLPGGNFQWVDGPLVLAMDQGKVLYIDEIALIDPKVLSIVYGVMDGRDELRVTQNPERGVVQCQTGFYVVAAQNPNAPGARMSEALLSRFKLQLLVTTDYGLAKKLGVNTKIVTTALNLAKKMDSNEISWAPQLRELLAFSSLEKLFGRDFACANLVSNAPEMDREVVADLVSRAFGEGAVSELKLD